MLEVDEISGKIRIKLKMQVTTYDSTERRASSGVLPPWRLQQPLQHLAASFRASHCKGPERGRSKNDSMLLLLLSTPGFFRCLLRGADRGSGRYRVFIKYCVFPKIM